MLYARKRDAYEYFIILIACRRNPADREGFDKALMGENLDLKKKMFKPGHAWTVSIRSFVRSFNVALRPQRPGYYTFSLYILIHPPVVHRRKTEPILFNTGHSPSISKLAQYINTQIHTFTC